MTAQPLDLSPKELSQKDLPLYPFASPCWEGTVGNVSSYLELIPFATNVGLIIVLEREWHRFSTKYEHLVCPHWLPFLVVFSPGPCSSPDRMCAFPVLHSETWKSHRLEFANAEQGCRGHFGDHSSIGSPTVRGNLMACNNNNFFLKKNFLRKGKWKQLSPDHRLMLLLGQKGQQTPQLCTVYFYFFNLYSLSLPTARRKGWSWATGNDPGTLNRQWASLLRDAHQEDFCLLRCFHLFFFLHFFLSLDVQ